MIISLLDDLVRELVDLYGGDATKSRLVQLAFLILRAAPLVAGGCLKKVDEFKLNTNFFGFAPLLHDRRLILPHWML